MADNTPVFSVGAEWPTERVRCEQVVAEYRALGPSGAFAVAWMSAVLARADAAWRSGDVVLILRSFQEMREIKL